MPVQETLGLTVLHLPDANTVKARWKIFLREKGMQALVGGHDFGRDDLLCVLGKLLLYAGGKILGKADKGLVKQALGRVLYDVLRNLCRHALHHHARLHDFFLDALFQERNGLIHILAQRIQSGQPVVLILFGLEAQRLGQDVRRLDALTLV